MKRKVSGLLVCSLVCSLLAPPATSLALPASYEKVDGIALVHSKMAAPIVIDKESEDYSGIKLAADAVSGDIELVTGCKPEVTNETPDDEVVIIAGTLDDQLIKDQGLNWEIGVSGNQFKSDQWERYQIQVIEESGQTKIVVAGSDKRGAIYGLFHLSQDLAGVSPWVWWSDVQPKKQEELVFSKEELEVVSKTPSVKYRGIFINNEAPSLSSYVKEHYGQYNYLFYSNVYELLLRLKANYLWPAMWSNSFSDDGILDLDKAKDKSNLNKLPEAKRDKLANASMAEDYGIVIGLSHHEPMARAGVEWQRMQSGANPAYHKNTYIDSDGNEKPLTVKVNEWNYFLNNQNIYDFWKDGMVRNGKFNNNLITIGMRGEGDSALKKPDGKDFTLQENVDLLKKVITDQKKILKEQGLENNPQALALYTEVQQYWYGYDAAKGETSDALREFEPLKDDIIVLCDDNYGYTRFLTYPDERDRNWGMYYHFDMNGGAHSYKWIDTVPLQRVWENMTMSYDYGVDDLWIVNVGDIKPLEVPISYFVDMAYDFDKWGSENSNSADEYVKEWTLKQFGSQLNEEESREVAQIIVDYVDMNGRCKPEVIFPNTFSTVNYNEAQKELQKAIELEARAEKYLGRLKGTPLEDAYYQLVYYPAAGAATVNKMMLFQGLNQIYAKRGSMAANTYADLVKDMIKRDKALLKYYNEEMSGGKWKLMQNQTEHVAYTSWQDSSGKYPVPSYVNPVPGGMLLVDVPGKDQAFKSGTETELPDIENTQLQQYPLNLSNGGDTAISYQVTADKDWIQFTGPTEGSMYTAQTLGVYADFGKLSGDDTGTITIAAEGGEQTVTVKVRAKIVNTDGTGDKTFYPSNGVISIGAENYSDAGDGISNDSVPAEWVKLDNYGKWGQTMKVFPTTEYFNKNPEQAPWLEYRIYVPEEGNYKVIGGFGHSNNLLPDSRLKYGVKIDEGQMTINKSISDKFGVAGISGEWNRGTRNSGRLAVTTHHLTSGIHTIRIYGIEADVQLQRLVVTNQDLIKKEFDWQGFNNSFYGPDETYYTGKEVQQQPLCYFQAGQQMSIPGTISGADCSNSDADKSGGVLNAKSGNVYTYPVTVAIDGVYLFSVNGQSDSNALAVIKINNTTATELKLAQEAGQVSGQSGVKLIAGANTLTLEVTKDAKITSITSELMDETPGLPVVVTASSNEKDAGKAFDGKNSTSWQPASTDSEPTLTVDLEDINYIDNITLLGNFTGVTGFSLQSSDDGNEWEDVYSSDQSPDNGKKIYFQGKTAFSGRQWRIVFSNYSEKLKVTEVKLNTFMNWARGDEETTVISEGGSPGRINKTEALLDGNRQGPKANNSWIINGTATATITFGKSHPLTGVNMFSVQDSVESGGDGEVPTDITVSTVGPTDYTVSYLNEEGSWKSVPKQSSNNKVLTYVDFGKTVYAKAIKVTAHTSGYVRVMEIEPVEARRYAFKETKIGNKSWDLSILGGTIKTINGKEAGGSEGNAYSGQRVSLIADEMEDNQAFSEWQVLLSPDDFVLKHPKEKGISFQMPEGDVMLKARYKTASPSEATAAFEANPKGWAYAEQDSLDQLLDSEDVITDSDKELMNNGGSTAVTVTLLKKDVSDQNGLVKKIKELWGNSSDLNTVFLMENSLSKAQKQKDGTTKVIPLASASEAVRVCMSVPDQWQDLDKDDFVLLHYNDKEDLEPTVTNTIFDWIGERRIEFDADVNGTYALVVPAVYTVTFKNYNGGVLKEVKVKSGEAATPPEDPQREGYIFYGWDKDFKEITKDLTVTAVFKKETAEDSVIKRLQGILDDLNDLEPDGVIETELAVNRIVKQVIAMDYSTYTNSEDVMELLEEIEEKIIDFSGIEPPYVKNSSSYSSVSVNGALFGLEGESGYLRIEDAPVSASLPKGVKKLFHAHAFDAKLYTDRGIKKNVKGLLKITLDLPEDIDSNEDIVVIHYGDGSSDGKRLNYSLSGDQISIITDSLSTFTIANVNIRTSDRSESESSDDNDEIRTEAAGIWQRAEKGWKYRNNDRSYAENSWKKIFYNGTYFWYYFGADGYMATGWLEEADGHLYYLEETKDKTEGIMATGWKNIEGKWYYFNTVSDGTMGRLFRNDITPDGYSVGENGSWIQ